MSREYTSEGRRYFLFLCHREFGGEVTYLEMLIILSQKQEEENQWWFNGEQFVHPGL